MNTVRALHDEAMKLSQLALVARETGNTRRAEELARQAYRYESQAADLVPDEQASEPTRSILYRSAASLAYQCKEFRAAQQLIAKGLSGHPPLKVEQELKILYEQVNFEAHLLSKGVTLENSEFRLMMRGNAVGFGSILYNEFTKRVDAVFSLVNRTVQRKMGRVYQGRGPVSRIYQPYTHVIDGIEGGSFIINLKLGSKEEPQQESFLLDTADVVNEIITGIELLNNSDEARLREVIPNKQYYQHFISATRELAPDGNNINSVVISSSNNVVSLTRSRYDIKLISEEEKTDGDSKHTMIKVEGILDYATAREGDVVGLTTAEGTQYNIVIKEGLDDMVRSYFKRLVVVEGMYDGRQIDPTDIQFSDNP